MGMNLTLKHTLSHPILPATRQARRVHVLIEIGGKSASQPLPMNISLVIDCSDSMRILMVSNAQFKDLAKSGNIVEVVTDGVPAWKIQNMAVEQLGGLPRRIDYVAEALRVISDRIRSIDYFSLIAFAQQSQIIIPTTSGKERRRLSQAANQLDFLSLGNETEMAPAMEQALGQIQLTPVPGMANRMVVLTDGYTKNAANCYQQARSAQKAGVTLTTMGMGNEFNEELLIPLADSTGGHSYFIEKPEQVLDAFTKELGSALSVHYRNMEVKIKLTPGVELIHAYHILPSLSELDPGPNDEGNYSFYLGDFDPTDPPSILLELQLPGWSAGDFRGAQMLLTCDSPDVKKPRLTMRDDVVFTMNSQGMERTNVRIVRLIEKVHAVELGTLALKEADQGNPGNATQKLRQAATRLLDMGEIELANTMLLQANILEQQGSLNPEVTKRLRYDTRKITRKLEE